MEGGISVHSDPESCRGDGVVVGAGQKTKRGKVVKGDSVSLGVGVGGTQKTMLADITNMQQQQQQQRCEKLIKQPEKQQFVPLGEADVSTEQLLKENATLRKLLASRNTIIESCKAELEKSRSNFQNLRKQNAELALTNSQMLAELNSSRQRLRELQLELGGKNGILKAMKLELTAKEKTEKLHESIGNEVAAAQIKQPNQSFQEESKEDNLCHAKRRRVSKSQSAAPAVAKQLTSKEKIENRRYSMRRESVKLKGEKLEPAEDNFSEEIKHDDLHLQETMANENERTSLGSNVNQEQAREDTSSSGPTNSEQVNAKKNIEKKRKSMRRQSGRFKPLNPEATEDSFEVDDAKFAVSHLSGNVSDKSAPMISSETSQQENKETCTSNPWETRRSSVGRPMRQTVGKVVSYKEIPVNMKMRRPK
ncbi:SHUGOSHIN 2 [Arachis stenosperma]|uniref:SHUGOSHIN 2 n=1 Tax=Arachis stenosperma TaxID=217475 RepID=UPI0025AD1FB8|nr:SHUGOSHIN 2 [Arachis stenosperma]